jgi:hypothetical protein
MHAYEGSPPSTIVIRFANLPSLVFLGKNKVGYFLNRVVFCRAVSFVKLRGISERKLRQTFDMSNRLCGHT